MGIEFDEQKALKELEDGYGPAKELLHDEDKMERFLQRLEKKLKVIPAVGDKLAYVPIMASLLKSFIKKEYPDVPIGSILAIISALLYVVSPIDIIPDFVPGAGYIDDAAVVVACWALVGTDVNEYQQWRIDNNKVLDV